MNSNKPGQSGQADEHQQYDGISENDHPLPGWWLMTFYFTAAFAAVYAFWFTVGPGMPNMERFNKDFAAFNAKVSTGPGKVEGPSEEVLMALVSQPDALNAGKNVFMAKCLACHGPQGQGVIGPNLTDNFWIHGDGKILAIGQIVTAGVPEKGMPPWGPLLTADEFKNVVAFVYSLRGSKPLNPKPPQGTEYP